MNKELEEIQDLIWTAQIDTLEASNRLQVIAEERADTHPALWTDMSDLVDAYEALERAHDDLFYRFKG